MTRTAPSARACAAVLWAFFDLSPRVLVAVGVEGREGPPASLRSPITATSASRVASRGLAAVASFTAPVATEQGTFHT